MERGTSEKYNSCEGKGLAIGVKVSRGQRFQTKMKQIEALRLRALGYTYERIAQTMGISETYAYDLVRDALKRERAESVQLYRTIELKRLERAIELVMAHIEQGDISATEKLVKLVAEEARLLGLYEMKEGQDFGTVLAQLLKERFGNDRIAPAE
jgi:DNA-binding CsgD family transcriptional regulator